MIRNILIIFFVIILSSCEQNDNAIIFDSSFLSIYPIKNTNNYTILGVDNCEVEVAELQGFDKIILSPLLFKQNRDDFLEYKGQLFVIDFEGLDDDKITNIKFNDEKAYRQLISNIEYTHHGERLKIIVFIDNDDSLKKVDVEILKELSNYDLSFFYITQQKNKASISSFIKKQEEVDLWVIDSKKYSLYIYELIKEGNIILKDGAKLQKLNDNVIMTLDYDFENDLFDIFNNNEEYIYSKLNIY